MIRVKIDRKPGGKVPGLRWGSYSIRTTYDVRGNSRSYVCIDKSAELVLDFDPGYRWANRESTFKEVGTWRQVPPFHKGVPGSGKWTKRIVPSGVCVRDDSMKHLFSLYEFPSKMSGHAYYPKGWSDVPFGKWRRVALPLPAQGSGVWGGLGVSGSAAAVVGGPEVMLAAVMAADTKEVFCFAMLTGRLGPSVGLSGSLGVVVVCGVQKPMDLDNHIQSGTSVVISPGPNLTGFVRNSKLLGMLSKLRPLLKAQKVVTQHLATLEAAVKRSDQLLMLLCQNFTRSALLNWQKRSVTFLPIPLAGGGEELGLYWTLGRCHVFRPGVAPDVPRPTGGDIHTYNY